MTENKPVTQEELVAVELMGKLRVVVVKAQQDSVQDAWALVSSGRESEEYAPGEEVFSFYGHDGDHKRDGTYRAEVDVYNSNPPFARCRLLWGDFQEEQEVPHLGPYYFRVNAGIVVVRVEESDGEEAEG